MMTNPNSIIESCWRQRQKIEKCLVLIVGILVLVIITVLSVNLRQNDCSQISDHTCRTPRCLRAAVKILDTIDTTADPCEDFYKFACGSFTKSAVIPDHKALISPLTTVSDDIVERLHHLFEAIPDDSIRPFLLLKEWYSACMNTAAIERDSVKHVIEMFNSSGGWPVLEGSTWNDDSFDWISTSHKLMKYGYTVAMLVDIYVSADKTNATKYSLFMDQVGLNQDRIKRIGFGHPIFEAYYQYMLKVVQTLGVSEARAKQDMKEVAELVVTIARITVSDDERRNQTLENNLITIRELEHKFEYVAWLDYINTKLAPYKKLSYDDVIIVKMPSYYEKLEDVLRNTSNRTLANYIYWMSMEGSISYLNEDLRDLELDYLKAVTGVLARPPRWKECTERGITLYVASGALYIRNFFNKESKQEVIEMVGYIKDQFVQNLKSVEWMDKLTKKHALDKLDAMHLHLAYPDELFDDEKLKIYFKNFSFDASNYIGSALNLSLLANEENFARLGEKFDKKEWRNHAYVVLTTAFYDFSENSIEFLAGILQDVFFNAENPKYMNYGAIGHFIGHEITHGFDDQGRQFDKNGNLFDWWQPATKASFDQKAQCIVDQYSNVSVPSIGLNLNGVNTQGENIADNAGIKLAYLAYKEWVKKHGPEALLLGLEYSPEQLFWISVGHAWCGAVRDEQLKNTVLQDQHVPSPYRVNVPLMNSEYFANDFKCSKESRMNPQHKCHVW